MAEPSD